MKTLWHIRMFGVLQLRHFFLVGRRGSVFVVKAFLLPLFMNLTTPKGYSPQTTFRASSSKLKTAPQSAVTSVAACCCGLKQALWLSEFVQNYLLSAATRPQHVPQEQLRLVLGFDVAPHYSNQRILTAPFDVGVHWLQSALSKSYHRIASAGGRLKQLQVLRDNLLPGIAAGYSPTVVNPNGKNLFLRLLALGPTWPRWRRSSSSAVAFTGMTKNVHDDGP